MNNTNKKRIQILSDAEVIDIYTRPAFNHLEREEYFVLDTATLATINTMTKLETKVYLILLIGYFRAKPVVPMFQLQEVRDDVEHVCHTYFEGAWIESWSISKSTRQKLVSKMLSILDYERYTTQDHQDNLTARLQDVATICSDPRYIFDECLAYFGQNRIALAGYSTLQDLVTEVVKFFRTQLLAFNPWPWLDQGTKSH